MMLSSEPHQELAVFVYGTLKAGFENHQHYCRGVRRVEPATTWGRLYCWEPAIPILEVPRASCLLRGSSDLADDLEAAGRVAAATVRPRPARRRGWRRIQGEVLIFPDPIERLALLDALEGFRPRSGARYYERVLLPITVTPSAYGAGGQQAAWVYVLPQDENPPGGVLEVATWQPGRA